MSQDPPDWIAPVAAMLDRGGRTGGFLLDLPDYRPDLIRALGHALDLTVFDVRAEILRPLGWDAHHVTLGQLDQELRQRGRSGGLIAHNAEALLATKDTTERAGWLTTFVAAPWPHAIVVPLFLFLGEAPGSEDRRAALPAESLPDETLIGRLASWGS